MFIYFWKRESEQGRSTERERERIRSRFCTVGTEPDAGLKLVNCEIMTWVEVRCWTNWTTEVPLKYFKWIINSGFNAEGKYQTEKIYKSIIWCIIQPLCRISEKATAISTFNIQGSSRSNVWQRWWVESPRILPY